MGMNVHRNVPELKMPTLFGIFGSAFCATLSHYYTELRPFIRSLPAMFTSVDDMITGVRILPHLASYFLLIVSLREQMTCKRFIQ